MAGTSLGAPSPTSSRTRRLHGVFPIGDIRLVIASSRRGGDALGIEVAAGDLRGIDNSMRLLAGGRGTAAQARLVARALLEAADAVDAAQRQPQFTRAAGAQGGAA